MIKFHIGRHGIYFYSPIFKSKYAVECSLFRSYQSFKEGIAIFDCNIGAAWFEGDHKPSVDFILDVFNITIIDFEIYNMYHLEDNDESEEA